MSSLQEIELGIATLSAEDRAKLLRDLPALFRKSQGDLAWQKLLSDPRPSHTLSRLADAVDAQFGAAPETFQEIQDSDFERHS